MPIVFQLFLPHYYHILVLIDLAKIKPLLPSTLQNLSAKFFLNLNVELLVFQANERILSRL